jgi:hypothetical protein
MSMLRDPYTCLYRRIWHDEKFWLRSELGQRIYIYILSCPMGNGMDTMRIYEALYMNKVPILIRGDAKNYKNSSNAYLYDLYNKLPILILDNKELLLDSDYIIG